MLWYFKYSIICLQNTSAYGVLNSKANVKMYFRFRLNMLLAKSLAYSSFIGLKLTTLQNISNALNSIVIYGFGKITFRSKERV